jgi:hypothetical protein
VQMLHINSLAFYETRSSRLLITRIANTVKERVSAVIRGPAINLWK